MDRFQPEQHLRVETETRICERHGEYLARQFIGKRYSRCPTCNAEIAQAQRKREEECERLRQEQQAQQEREFNVRHDGLGGRFRRATFANFDAVTPAQAAALEACKTFAQTITSTSGGGLWLCGPPGTGKTHLASAMATHLIFERGMGACVHGAHVVMRMLRARFGMKESKERSAELATGERLLRHLCEVPLLVLDEIGVSRGGEWEAEQLFTIVDERYRLERPTVLASNIPAEKLKPVLGDRVYDRLRDGALYVPMVGPSYRGRRSQGR